MEGDRNGSTTKMEAGKARFMLLTPIGRDKIPRCVPAAGRSCRRR